LVEVQDFRKTTDRLGGIYGVYPRFIEKTQETTTHDMVDLEHTLDSLTDYALISPQTLR
jgi:hypothetical protein